MNILEEAGNLINGQRAQDYGNVSENFNQIAGLWSAYKGVEFNAYDVSLMMILVKVARLDGKYHRDSITDIAGYAALAEKVHDYVYEEEVADNAVLPRVWDSFDLVPPNVIVRDAEGDQWLKSPNGDVHVRFRDDTYGFRNVTKAVVDDDSFAPYTEVLEGN